MKQDRTKNINLVNAFQAKWVEELWTKSDVLLKVWSFSAGGHIPLMVACVKDLPKLEAGRWSARKPSPATMNERKMSKETNVPVKEQ